MSEAMKFTAVDASNMVALIKMRMETDLDSVLSIRHSAVECLAGDDLVQCMVRLQELGFTYDETLQAIVYSLPLPKTPQEQKG